jgi:uncharacterized membrane protein
MRVALLSLLIGCATTAADSAEPCADAPLVTYDNFGRGFLTQNCQPCHSAETSDRHGADPSVTFDSYDDVVTEWDAIARVATGADPVMPPSGGVPDDEREKLSIWLTCGE